MQNEPNHFGLLIFNVKLVCNEMIITDNLLENYAR